MNGRRTKIERCQSGCFALVNELGALVRRRARVANVRRRRCRIEELSGDATTRIRQTQQRDDRKQLLDALQVERRLLLLHFQNRLRAVVRLAAAIACKFGAEHLAPASSSIVHSLVRRRQHPAARGEKQRAESGRQLSVQSNSGAADSSRGELLLQRTCKF